MGHINCFKSEYLNNAKSQNVFVRPKCMAKEKPRNEEWKKNIVDWATFYKRNIHRFIQHYFGIKLHPYQIIWIYFMSISDYFISIASRASAKSWLIAVYACAIAVLYPHSEIVLVAVTQKTAGIIMGKIEGLKKDYPNLNREIEKFSNTQSERCARFHSGSTVKVVACSEGGRGERATLTIAEEFAILKRDLYESIVKPFSYARQSPYMKLKDWKDLPPEEPKEIKISSARHKGENWYLDTCDIIKKLVKGENVGFIAFDYLIAIEHKIKTKKLIEKERTTMNSITFQEEYMNIAFGQGNDCYYTLSLLEKAQNLKKAFYPQRNDTYNKNKNPYGIKRIDGELRVISIDVATRASSDNDNTIMSCIRCIPTSSGYHRDVCYMESHMGENTILQALRIKQLKVDFDADYIVIDIQNAGISIFDSLSSVTKDYERDLEYEPYTVVENTDLNEKTYQELTERAIGKNGLPIIYPISATAQLNNDIAVCFRDKLQKDMISLLINEMDAEDYLSKNNKDYMKYSDEISERAWYLHPYIQTSALVNECVSLSMSLVSGYIKLKEPTGGRKDRYTSVSYGNYFIANNLDPRLLKDEDDDDMEDILNYVVY